MDKENSRNSYSGPDYVAYSHGTPGHRSGGADMSGVPRGGDREQPQDWSTNEELRAQQKKYEKDRQKQERIRARQAARVKAAEAPTTTPTSTRAPQPAAPAPATPAPDPVAPAPPIGAEQRLGAGVQDQGVRTFSRPGSRSFNPFLGRAFGVNLAQPGALDQARTRFGITSGDIGRRNAQDLAGAGAIVAGGGGFGDGLTPGDPLESLLATQLLG